MGAWSQRAHDLSAEACGKAGMECRYASVKYPLRLAGARVAGSGVGMPEARGLCRAPPNGHAGLAPGESGGCGRREACVLRCVGHGPSHRAVASSRMSGVIRRRRYRAAVVFEGWVPRGACPGGGSFRAAGASGSEHVCTSVRGSGFARVSGPPRVAPLGGVES